MNKVGWGSISDVDFMGWILFLDSTLQASQIVSDNRDWSIFCIYKKYSLRITIFYHFCYHNAMFLKNVCFFRFLYNTIMVFIFINNPENWSDTATIYHKYSIFSTSFFEYTTMCLCSPPRFKEKIGFQKKPW